MADHAESTRWHRLVAGETLAAAHQLRAIGHRLETLAQCLPLPREQVRTHVFESGTEEDLDAHPTLALYTDLSVLASDEIFGIAMSLREAAEKYAPPELHV